MSFLPNTGPATQAFSLFHQYRLSWADPVGGGSETGRFHTTFISRSGAKENAF
jgi:hypothetical protein